MSARIASIGKALQFHKLIKIRQRYVLTRGNKLRLRYVSGVLICALVSVGIISDLHNHKGVATGFSQLVSVAAASVGNVSHTEAGKFHDHDKDAEVEELSIAGTLRDHLSSSLFKAQQVLIKPKRPPYREIEIEKGDTIAGSIQQAGIDGAEAYKIVESIKKHYDPRQVKVGQKFRLYFSEGSYRPNENGIVRPEFQRLTMKLDATKEIIVQAKEDGSLSSQLIKKKVSVNTYARSTKIETSLYGSALREGIPSAIVAEVIRVYSWDVDFQRDIRRGDTLQVLYEVHETEEGDVAKYGNVLYANLSIGGHKVPVYRFKTSDGRIDYYEEGGHSIKKTLMKTPVDGARLSSGYGMRKHPIEGYTKMHKGLDFAAPTGTPIYAAGDGVIEYSGRKGTYGNYIRVRHNSTLKTAYAHLHKIHKRAHKGNRVKQGNIIGYVGTTGRSTGPHLHYEVLVNNSQVNPNSVNLPVGEQLKGKDLKNFKALVARMNKQYASASGETKVAQRSADAEDKASRIR